MVMACRVSIFDNILPGKLAASCYEFPDVQSFSSHGIDHFRTPVERGAELIRDALRGHTTGLAQPMHVIATNIGKIPLMPDYYITGKDEQSYYLRNHKGEETSIPNMPE